MPIYIFDQTGALPFFIIGRRLLHRVHLLPDHEIWAKVFFPFTLIPFEQCVLFESERKFLKNDIKNVLIGQTYWTFLIYIFHKTNTRFLYFHFPANADIPTIKTVYIIESLKTIIRRAILITSKKLYPKINCLDLFA